MDLGLVLRRTASLRGVLSSCLQVRLMAAHLHQINLVTAWGPSELYEAEAVSFLLENASTVDAETVLHTLSYLVLFLKPKGRSLAIPKVCMETSGRSVRLSIPGSC